MSQRQREIVAATFKVVRDRAATSDKETRENVSTILLSQGRLREQVATLEQRLKQRGVRTVHYVSPSVWAWRESRAEKIGQSADLVLCLFPMEPAIYARHGVDARFVGHPLADALPLEPDRDAARQAFEAALACAHAQDARSLELRAAIELYQLRRDQGAGLRLAMKAQRMGGAHNGHIQDQVANHR